MQQGGQLEFDGEFQLRLEQLLLPRAVQLFEKVVQADLAHCAEPGVPRQALQPVAQLLQVFGLVLVEVHGVQAEGGVQAILLLHLIPQALPVGLVDAEQYQTLDTQRAAAREQCGAVGVELGKVEVGVGIDQAHGASVGAKPAGRKGSPPGAISDARGWRGISHPASALPSG